MSKKSHKKERVQSPKTEEVIDLPPENLCDDKWTCNVVFLIENDVTSNNFINICQQFKQILPGVKNLNKNDLLKEVKKKSGSKKSSSSPKKKDRKDQTPVELTDEQKVMKAVKENTSIPAGPLSKIIKKTLLLYKADDIKERTKQYTDFLLTQKKKPKPPISKKGTKKDEQATEETFVERPPLFIILSGFYEYDLPLCLLNEDVPVKAVIKLKEPEQLLRESILPEPSSGLAAEKFTMNWLKFWYKFENLMDIPTNGDVGNNLAHITINIPDKIKDPTANAKDKKLLVHNEMMSMVNYIQTLFERHRHYLNDTIIYDIPLEVLPLEEATVYQTLTKMVPLECISVPFILFCIIEQVCYLNGEEIIIKDKYNETKIHENKSDMFSPVIIMHNDEELLRTFHLKVPELNLTEITTNVLSKMVQLKPLHAYQLNNVMKKYFYEFHLQRLWKHIENNDTIGINLFYIYFHWFILCKMKTYHLFKKKSQQINDVGNNNNNNNSNHSGEILDRELIDEWIDELIRNLILRLVSDDYGAKMTDNKPDLCKPNTSLSNNPQQSRNNSLETENDNNVKHHEQRFKDVRMMKMLRKENLKLLRNFLFCHEVLCLQEHEQSPKIFNFFKTYVDFDTIEEMSPEVMLQTLHNSLLNYCNCETLFYPPTNKVVFWFYNNKGTIHEEQYSVGLNTLVGFRDFYEDVILPEELESKRKLLIDDQSAPSQIDDELMINEQPEITKIKSSESIYVNNEAKNTETVNFNLGMTKIKFDNIKKQFISEDGSSVTVETNHWYKTSKNLKIDINKIDSNLKVYKQVLESSTYEMTNKRPDEAISLVLTLPNGIFLNIHAEEKYCLGESANDRDFIMIGRKFIYNDFTVTLPTGLIIEIIKNSLDNDEIYIKQSYISKGPDCNIIWDEKCRCFLKNGTIIVYKNDETIDIIYSNTVYTSIQSIIETVDESPIEPESESPVISEPEIKSQERKIKTSSNEKNASNEKEKRKKNPQLEVIDEVKEQEKEKDEIIKRSVYKVTEHSVSSWSGIKYEFKDDECLNVINNDVNLRTIFSPYKQLFVDRNDGIKSILNEDGSLESVFQDGTKIMTSFYVEDLEVDISDELIEMEPQVTNRYQSISFSRRSFPLSGIISERSFPTQLSITDGSANEPFTSIMLHCVMEHPNYARVEFSPEDESITLTLPEGIIINIRETADKESFVISVTFGKKLQVLFSDDTIGFASNIYNKCNKYNTTIIKPSSEVNKPEKCTNYFCTTLDSFSHIFLVDNDGEVRLINTKTEKIDQETHLKEFIKKISITNFKGSNSYFDDYIPEQMFNRYFVLNENFSGYEIINKNDVDFLNQEEKRKYNNVSVVSNPKQGRIDSEMRQHLIYMTHSEKYLVPYITGKSLSIPHRFQRIDLGPTWSPSQSPWFLIRSERVIRYFKQFSLSDIPRSNEKRIIAVVIKTVQKIIDEDKFKGISIILNCLKKCCQESEELYKTYKGQSFTDFDIDARLRETDELISKVKNDFPLWNSIKVDCDICKQQFGKLRDTDTNNILESQDKSESFEQVVKKFDY